MHSKRCSRCRNEYPATAEFFFRYRRKKDGLTSQCKACRKLMWREQYLKHRDKRIAKATEDTRLRRQREDVRERERIASREAKRRQLADPVEREKHRQRTRDFFKNREKVRALPSRNKETLAHYAACRNAAELRAMPFWADRARIAEFYREAQRLTLATGIPHEVDHIVPLRYKLASGLHVPANLQVVTRTENRSKSNRFISN